jgi:ribosomal protein S18 acetylase RimI-like enzyme
VASRATQLQMRKAPERSGAFLLPASLYCEHKDPVLPSASQRIARLHTPDDPRFAQLLTIYTEAHPASERKTVDQLAAMITRPEYLFLVAEQPSESAAPPHPEKKVAGFAIALCLPNTDACLLEYMAIAPGHRNQGIGQYLFQQVLAHPELAGRFLLAEVDSDKLPCPDRADRTRRKAFYSRLGCREIAGLNYHMPPVSTATPPPMDLLVHHPDRPGSISKAAVKAWLTACYTAVYAMPADDPRIAAMLRDLPDTCVLLQPPCALLQP